MVLTIISVLILTSSVVVYMTGLLVMSMPYLPEYVHVFGILCMATGAHSAVNAWRAIFNTGDDR